MPPTQRTRRCQTCKQRRIRCDQKSPPCGPCIKGRRRCVALEEAECFRPWIGSYDASLLSGSIAASSSWTQHSDHTEHRGGASSMVRDGTFASILEPSNLAQLWQRFLSLHQGSVSRSVLDESMSTTTSLWQSLAQLRTDSSLPLQYALAAVASARIGKIESNSALYNAASYAYNSAISRFRESLGNTDFGTSDTSTNHLATVLVLAQYEFYQDSSQGFGHISHAHGATRLVESMGSHHFTSGLRHNLFVNFRVLEIVHALLRRKSTYLCHGEWLSHPWAIHAKSSFDWLLDIASQLPSLQEETDSLRTRSEDITEARLRLITKYWVVYDKLEEWYEKFKLTNGNFEPSINREYGRHDSAMLFGRNFEHKNIETAHCMVKYWAFCVVSTSGVTWEQRALRGEGLDYKQCINCSWSVAKACRCDYNPPLNDFDDSGLRRLPTVSGAIERADNISRSVSYLLQPKLKAIGAEICVFSLRVAYEIYRFRNLEEKVNWTLKIFGELEDWGISWGRSLAGMQAADYQDRVLGGKKGMFFDPMATPNVLVEQRTSPGIELVDFVVV